MGVLDGVHLGHRAVVAEAARALPDAQLAALTFEPSPKAYFQPDAPPFRLQTPAQRLRALAALGVAAVIETPFDSALASLSEEEFARDVLAGQIGARHVAVGVDFRFGRGRGGDATALAMIGEIAGFSVSAVAPVCDETGARISSTRIRAHVAAGEMAEAASMLGRPFAIEGAVLQGQQRGRTIGFPTANVSLGAYVRPAFGVYAIRARIDGAGDYAGVANLGVRPTVGATEPLLEAHLFDASGDFYGKILEADLIAFLRPERKFDSFDALKTQIATDAAQARALLSR